MGVFSLLLTCALLLVSFPLISLLRNYNTARAIGLPIVISPASPSSKLCLIFGNQIARVLWLLPGPLKTCASIIYLGWQYDDARKPVRDQIHTRYGSAFLVVSPAGIEAVFSDPTAIHEVLKRVNHFLKPDLYKPLDMYGHNVNTLNGENWARHRRLTAPCFNERTSSLVWDASCTQAQSMLEQWVSRKGELESNLVDDTRTAALHVLLEAAFDISYRFSGGVRQLVPGFTTTYDEAVRTVLDNILLVFLCFSALKMRKSWWQPRKLQQILIAATELQFHMSNLLDHERELMQSRNQSPRRNLANVLLRASEKEIHSRSENTQKLTREEVMGNLFIFNLAGHDTTANTLAFSLALLAAYPEWQQWLLAEIITVADDAGELVYERCFPRLKRCRAFMYETLRLYAPAPYIPRIVDSSAQSITLSSENIFALPPATPVTLNLQALHTNPKFWGQDSLSFRPSRWITVRSQENMKDAPVNPISEDLIEPGPNFAPWISGPRVCLGMKFAQVEFVAVLSTLLRSAAVKPEYSHVDQEMARKRLVDIIEDSGFVGSTLGIKRPGEVSLRWELRQGR